MKGFLLVIFAGITYGAAMWAREQYGTHKNWPMMFLSVMAILFAVLGMVELIGILTRT